MHAPADGLVQEAAKGLEDLLRDTSTLNKTASEAEEALSMFSSSRQTIEGRLQNLRSTVTGIEEKFEAAFPGRSTGAVATLEKLLGDAVRENDVAVSKIKEDINTAVSGEFSSTKNNILELNSRLESSAADIQAYRNFVVDNTTSWSQGRQDLLDFLEQNLQAARAEHIENVTSLAFADSVRKSALVDIIGTIHDALAEFSKTVYPEGAMNMNKLEALKSVLASVNGTVTLNMEAAKARLIHNADMERNRLDEMARSQLKSISEKVGSIGDQMVRLLSEPNFEITNDPETMMLSSELSKLSDDAKTELSDLLEKMKTGMTTLDTAMEQVTKVKDPDSMDTLEKLGDALIDAVAVFRSRMNVEVDQAMVPLIDFDKQVVATFAKLDENIETVAQGFKEAFAEDAATSFRPIVTEIERTMQADLEDLKKKQVEDANFVAEKLSVADAVIADLNQNLTALYAEEFKAAGEIVNDVKSRITNRLRSRLGSSVQLETAKIDWDQPI
jgi:hypothetical protein